MRGKQTLESATTDVFITVSGGVAYVAKSPENVKVHLIDYDDLACDFEGTFGRFSAIEKMFYNEMINKENALRDGIPGE